jgi:hypothetical protein
LQVPTGASYPRIAVLLLANTGQQLLQMLGVVGWLDTPAPLVTVVAWVGVLAVVVGLAVATGRRRHLVVLGALVAGSVLVPVALRLPKAHSLGLVGQGRDTMPLVVGVPILAAWVLGGRVSLRPRTVHHLKLLVAVGVTVGQEAMFLWALRRYEVGLSGPLNFFDGGWRPPVPLGLLVAGFTAVVVLFDWWLFVLGTRPLEPSSDPPAV